MMLTKELLYFVHTSFDLQVKLRMFVYRSFNIGFRHNLPRHSFPNPGSYD